MAELDDRLRYNPPGAPKPITRVDEYRGERVVQVSATQLGTEASKTEASTILTEWTEFFSSGPVTD